MRCSRARRLLGSTVTAVFLASCSPTTHITKIKYIQHHSSTKLKLGDGSVVTAPSGRHFMLYLVNCIDNSTREEAFFFTSDRLRDSNNQNTWVSSVPKIFKLVGAGDTATKIGQVVLELSGPPEKVFENMLYAAQEGESVLMVNQTILGPEFGPAVFLVDQIDLVSATKSPFVESNLCADTGSFH